MTVLYGRRWALQVDTLDLTDLDLAFKVTRSAAREPNAAEIRVWNLSRDTRAAVERGSLVLLRAGYEDPPTLFRGDIRRAFTVREGPDYVTTIVARDGGRAYSEARFARSYAAGTRCATVLRDVIEAMEIGTGNLDEFESAFTLRNGASTFVDGYVAAGPARRTVNDLARAAGLRWSVQAGALQLQVRGQPLQTRAVVLAADSGLVESPTWDDVGQRTSGRRGVCQAKTLIQPGLDPGRRVRLEADLVSGDFEVRKSVATGDTRGNDWHLALDLRPVS